MQTSNLQVPPPPPGVISALTAGFNAVATQVGVILFPIGFDLFFWLGPRLKIAQVMAPVLESIKTLGASTEGLDVQSIINFWQNFNLFSLARTFPLGIFSLNSLNSAAQSPLGTRLDLEAANPFAALGAWAGLSLLGWLLGSLYFQAVAQTAIPGNPPASTWRALLQGVLFSALWAALGLAIGLPFAFFLGIAYFINPTLGLLVNLAAALFLMWLLLPVFFSSYGIFVDQKNVFSSLWNTAKLLRYGLPTITLFTLVALTLAQGMDFLWRIPPATSWLTLMGIFGHAFISTGLLAASFIYYREMTLWVEAATRWFNDRRVTAR